MRVWDKATDQPWALTRDSLTGIIDIAAKQNQSPEVVAAKLGRELHNGHQVTDVATKPTQK